MVLFITLVPLTILTPFESTNFEPNQTFSPCYPGLIRRPVTGPVNEIRAFKKVIRFGTSLKKFTNVNLGQSFELFVKNCD